MYHKSFVTLRWACAIWICQYWNNKLCECKNRYERWNNKLLRAYYGCGKGNGPDYHLVFFRCPSAWMIIVWRPRHWRRNCIIRICQRAAAFGSLRHAFFLVWNIRMETLFILRPNENPLIKQNIRRHAMYHPILHLFKILLNITVFTHRQCG